MLTINETLGVPGDELHNKKHNLWIGVSFGNAWFNETSVRDLITLGLTCTKDSLLILIPGRMHAINLSVFDRMTEREALRAAFAQEDRWRTIIDGIINNLPPAAARRIIMANYDDMLTPTAVRQLETLWREFADGGAFYERVVAIAGAMLERRGRSRSRERDEQVAKYVVMELPLFLGGARKSSDGELHTVNLYPGLGAFDHLVMDIRYGQDFLSLRERLGLRRRVGIASVH